MLKASDNTDRAKKVEGKHSNEAPVRNTERPGTRGSLRSSRANSRVDAEWADRTGWGGAGENGPIQKLSGPALPVPEGPSAGQACRKHRVPAEGEEPTSSEGRGSPGLRARPFSPLTHLNPLMAGTVTTRKHVRTHALQTQPVQARARKRGSPAPQGLAPPLTEPIP